MRGLSRLDVRLCIQGSLGRKQRDYNYIFDLILKADSEHRVYYAGILNSYYEMIQQDKKALAKLNVNGGTA